MATTDTRLVLGLGTGRCGTHSLADILDRQPGARFTHEEWPLLPWKRRPAHGAIEQRLRRIRMTRQGSFLGDVASFYLPYVEDAILAEPGIRLICLERTREDVVASFGRWLDTVHPIPTDHWSSVPAPGWNHDPFWTRIFPQYDVSDREAGLRRYWDEYHSTAAAFQRRHPERFRIFPTAMLNEADGLREILTFAGIPEDLQVIPSDVKAAPSEGARVHPYRAFAGSAEPGSPRRCVVLVAYRESIHPACESGLRALERQGFEVRRLAIAAHESPDLVRGGMVLDALCHGFQETMWIEPDTGFAPESVDRLRARGEPIVCAIGPRPGEQALDCEALPGTPALLFGQAGGLQEVLRARLAFALIRRPVYADIQLRCELPVCDELSGRPLIPYFQPTLAPQQDGLQWLDGDAAFCDLARRCGHRIWADTTIRLWRHGLYGYGWEDAGRARDRHDAYRIALE